MRGYPALVSAFFKSQVREPVSFFFVIIFSPAVLTILALIFGNDPAPQFGMRGFVDQMLPGFTVISVVIVGVMLVPQNQLLLRASGALTRLRITPLKPRTYVAADLTVQFCFGMVGAVTALLVGILGFGVDWPKRPLGVLVAVAFGLLTMLAIGYTLAALYPNPAAATGIGNGLMVILMMTSGAFIPTAVLSDGVQAAFKFSPVYHIAALVDASWSGSAWPWGSVVVLAGVVVVFSALGTLLFKWDRAR